MVIIRAKRHLLAGVLHRTGCDRLLGAVRRWAGVLVLNYHRIGCAEGQTGDPDLWSASEEEFDRQLGHLKSSFDVISLPDLSTALGRSGRQVLITFDDGYRDNYERAYPILKRHGISATFFLATGYLDRPRLPWWDEIHWMFQQARPISATCLTGLQPEDLSRNRRPPSWPRICVKFYKTLSQEAAIQFLEELAQRLGTGRCPSSVADHVWMTWDMVREMHAGGQTFGGHTVDHPVLANCSLERQAAEIVGCRQRLEDELKTPMTAFSYPVGGPNRYNSQTVEIVRKAGFKWGLSFSGSGLNTSHSPRYQLSRAAVESEMNFDWFSSMTYLPTLFR